MSAAHAAFGRIVCLVRVPRLAQLLRPCGHKHTVSCRRGGFGLPWWQRPLCGSLQRHASGGGARGPAAPAALASEVCTLRGTVFDVPGPQASDLAELLLAEGAQSAAVEEFRPAGGSEQEIYEDRSEARGPQIWDRCSVVAYFPPEEDGVAGVLATAAAALGLACPRVSVEGVKGEDWEGAIRDSYQPTEVAPGLWIVPAWSAVPPEAATAIVLEPGLAFGTGDHPTTRLCLRWLREVMPAQQGAAVMDYGTGSGVLALGALLLGAGRAVGTDVDSLAVRAATANAGLNSLASSFAAYPCSAAAPEEGGGPGAEPLRAASVPAGEAAGFGVVVANILRGPLVALAPRLAGYAAPGAALGLSGILAEQAPAVIEAYSHFFEDFRVELDGGDEGRWALVTARRRRG